MGGPVPQWVRSWCAGSRSSRKERSWERLLAGRHGWEGQTRCMQGPGSLGSGIMPAFISSPFLPASRCPAQRSPPLPPPPPPAAPRSLQVRWLFFESILTVNVFQPIVCLTWNYVKLIHKFCCLYWDKWFPFKPKMSECLKQVCSIPRDGCF